MLEFYPVHPARVFEGETGSDNDESKEKIYFF
jgi:hypothetical protein